MAGTELLLSLQNQSGSGLFRDKGNRPGKGLTRYLHVTCFKRQTTAQFSKSYFFSKQLWAIRLRWW